MTDGRTTAGAVPGGGARDRGPRRLIFLAPPGGGKSTQAQRVADALGVPHLSTGDLLREEVDEGSELGRKARPYMERGELVPDDLVVGMLGARIGEEGGFVLDGFPRDRPQAEVLERRLGGVDRVVVLTVPEDEVVRRLAGRRECPHGHVYHVEVNPPAAADRCDVDGEPLRRREDDRPEVIQNRLRVYEERTRPLIDFYEERGAVVEVDGTGDPDAITRRLLDRLGPP